MKFVPILVLLLLISVVQVESFSLYRRVPLPPIDRFLKELGESQISANKRFTADMLFNEEEWPPRFI